MENMNEERKRPPSPQKPLDAGAGSPQKVPTKTLRPMLIPVVASVTAVCILIGIISVIAGITASIAGGSEVPRVRSAEDAIAVLSDRAGELGYENALSELTELHTNTVAGHSYYRLQQNYNGIPVYGRTVVYAADERGALLSVTQNIQDVPDDLDLMPTITRVQATDSIRAYLAETYPDLAWEDIPVVSLDKEALCIYSLDGTAHLAYESYMNGIVFHLDAHTGEVLRCNHLLGTAMATFANSDDTLEVPRLSNGLYLLKDENTDVYVYSAEGREYLKVSNSGNYEGDPDKLTMVTSEDLVFGSKNPKNDSVNSKSIECAKASLDVIRDCYLYFFSLRNRVPDNPMLLIYDVDWNNAGYFEEWRVDAYLNSGLPDDPSNDTGRLVNTIILGEDYSDDPEDNLDVIAHEYTHLITDEVIDFAQRAGENGAINEAFSDIFAELIEADMKNMAPDWQIVDRPINNPWENNLPVTIHDSVPGSSDSEYVHNASTIISHTAYRMWVGLDGVRNSSLTEAELAELWYRAMLMMPSDADFADCRYVVETAAEAIGLNENQRQCVRQAFDYAGIAAASDNQSVDFQVDSTFSVTIIDADNERCTDCELIVRDVTAAYGPCLPDDNPIIWNSGISERCHLTLKPGRYCLEVKTGGNLTASEHYLIEVGSSTLDEINIYMNQGKSMLDIQVFGSGDHGSETPLPGAAIEIYRDNSNTPVYHGIVNENGDALRIYLEPDSYTVVALMDGYERGQTTINMCDTSVRYCHSFTLAVCEEEPSSGVTLPENSSGDIDTSGEVPYRIVHWDRSYRTEDGQSGMNYYFDYVVLESDSDGCRKINETLYQDAERFMSFHDGNSVVTDPIGNPIIGSYTAESEVIYNQNGLLCIKVYTHDAMGGNTDHVDSYSMFFNLNTGEIATLADLTGIDEETLLPQLRSIAITKLKNQYGSMLLDSAENTVSNMQLEEFDYYVYEGEIWLHFEKYSVTPGVCGAVNISTGLYLGGNGEQQPAD